MAEKHENSWAIDNFFELDKKEGFSLASPVFRIGVQDKLMTEWRLLLYPCGEKSENLGYVSLFLQLERSNFDKVEAEYEFWFSGQKQKLFTSGAISKEFSVSWIDFRLWGSHRLVSTEQLRAVITNDQLRVFCSIQIKSFGGTALDIVSQDGSDKLWALYTDQKLADFVIKVEDKEYHVHKVILASKSPVFSAMFDLEMTEKASNGVTITDYKPKAIECFIEFIYRGSCEGLEGNAAELLALAEKYDVTTLKAVCEVALARLLTVDTAVNTITLAHVHNATFLKETAVLFISRNIREVMKRDGWTDLTEDSTLIDAIVHALVVEKK